MPEPVAGELTTGASAWRIYQIPILLGIVSVIFIALSITIFIKSYQVTQPIQFSDPVNDESTTKEASASTNTSTILVDIEGAVMNPGVYQVPFGSRVDDGIMAAGGYSTLADTVSIARTLNRAAKLSDGAKLYIPTLKDTQIIGVIPVVAGASGTVAGARTPAISINIATQSQLEQLSGIGPVTAGKLISGRPYMRLEELVEKKIISQTLFTKLKDQLSL